MVVAVAQGARGRRARASSAPRPATRRPRPRPTAPPPASRCVVVLPARPDRRSASCSRRSSLGARVVAVDGNFDEALRGRPRARRAGRPPGHARQLGQPVPARGPEDGRVRGLRRPRPGARHPRDPGRQRRQHQRLLGAASASTARGRAASSDGRGCGASRPPARRRSCSATRSSDPETIATAIRIGNPASWDAGDRRPRRVGRPDRRRHRRRDPRRLPRARAARGRLLRAVVGGVAWRASRRRPRRARSTRTRSSCAS